jgi:hypothetical protein
VDGTSLAPEGATATYKWFADGKEIKQAAGDTSYKLRARDFGKTITVEATGTGKFIGSSIESAETGVVSAIGELGIVRDGEVELTKATVVGVGNVLTPTIKAFCYNHGKLVDADVTGLEKLATYVWTIGDVTVEDDFCEIMPSDAGKTWSCTASGIDEASLGALTWNNGLVIADSAQDLTAVDTVYEVTEDDYPVHDVEADGPWYSNLSTNWSYNAPIEVEDGESAQIRTVYYSDYDTQQVGYWTQYRAKGDPVVLATDWYTNNGEAYIAAGNVTRISGSTTYYKIVDENPQALGWYELSGSKYVLTKDTSVDPNKVYFVEK